MSEKQVTENNGGYGGPDPSALTVNLVLRELNSLSAIIAERFTSVSTRFDNVDTRFTAMDKAQTLFHDDLVRVPTHTDKAVLQLKELHEKMFLEKFQTIDERFHSMQDSFQGIQLQFKERDTRTEQSARGNETALTNALNAAKEAVSQQNIAFGQATSKAEAGFIKQIDQLSTLFQTGMKSLDEKIGMATKTSDDKITGLEKQLTLLVGVGAGRESQHTTQQTSNQNILAYVVAGMGLIGLIATILFNLMRNKP